MAKRLKVYDDYYVNAMFEDPKVRSLYYSSVIEIEYGKEGYVLIFQGRSWKGNLFAPFVKHGIPVVLENEETK